MCVGLTRRIFMRKYCNTLFALFGFFALTVFSSCATTSMVDDSTLFGRVFSSDSNERQIHLFDSSSNEAITISSMILILVLRLGNVKIMVLAERL